LAGCGGKAATETTTTDEPLATPEEVLVGNWHGEVEVDQEAVAKKLEEAKDLDERAKNRVYWSIETPTSLKSKLTLNADGSMKMAATISTAEGEKQKNGVGTWEVLSAGGDQATVRLSYEGQVEEKIFTFEDADAFATDPPGIDKTIGTLKFKRLR
jgi:hypothetical protein